MGCGQADIFGDDCEKAILFPCLLFKGLSSVLVCDVLQSSKNAKVPGSGPCLLLIGWKQVYVGI